MSRNIHKKNLRFAQVCMNCIISKDPFAVDLIVLKFKCFKTANYGYFLYFLLKFMFSKKATKIEEIFTAYLTLCSNCQIDGEDFVNFCGLLRKHELYWSGGVVVT